MENVFLALNSIKIIIKSFTFADAVDVLSVAFLIYGFTKLIKGTKAEQFVKGLLVILIGYIFSNYFRFKMLGTLLNNFFQFGFLALLVVFQPEIRKALERIGQNNFGSYWNYILSGKNKSQFTKLKNIIDIISESVFEFQKYKIGALIVFERKTKIGDVINTGIILKAKISVALILSIFYKKAPLHDGAMIIKDELIYSCGSILPLSKNKDLSSDFGTRHRAAVGISENSDAVAVVVSEESGTVSIAANGILKKGYNIDNFKNKLKKLLIEQIFENNAENIANF